MRRRKDKIDGNQVEIVNSLKMMGYSVETGHDDILVGVIDRDGEKRTFWFEIKSGPKAQIQPSQQKLIEQWKGQYHVVWSLEQIITVITGGVADS